MPRPQLKLAGISLLVFVAGVVAWSNFGARPPIAMTLTGFVTNRWPAEIITKFGGPETYVCAIVAITNQSARPFSYWTHYSKESVVHGLEKMTSKGWAPEPLGFVCGTGMEEYTLNPGEGFTFQATIKPEEPCKVSLTCTDVEKSKSVWQRLPGWLLERMPWANLRHTVTSDIIDLRKPRS